MIDTEGYRANVGIILANQESRLFWGRRIGQDSWQFPQGGIQKKETPEQALYRELQEEVGLLPKHVEVLGRTKDWLRYQIPSRFLRRGGKRHCIGQKQIWFLLRLSSSEREICLDNDLKPEFDDYSWVDIDLPPLKIVDFKREVYRSALAELSGLLKLNER